jgi:hypothetical protein
MKPLTAAMRELVSLFVDDGSLALALLAVVAAAALLRLEVGASSPAAGLALLGGAAAVLIENTARAVRQRK